VSLLSRPKIEILAPVTRAIHLRQVVKIDYMSKSGHSTREIVPFAIGCDGLRWHVRAFDRKGKRFSDFVFTRMSNAEISVGEKPRTEESWEQDDQWNRMLDLPIIPHPDKDSTELVVLDYGMRDGLMRLRVRAAMAGYVLQQYHIDCSPDHSIKDYAYRLWLSDPLALYGVESAIFAPGYTKPTNSV
jgi:predicted DNA-binding transcriptional regulator YafY